MSNNLRQADIEEIEITPAMIEAGAHEYWSFDDRFDPLSDAVIRIWRAMERARTLECASEQLPANTRRG